MSKMRPSKIEYKCYKMLWEGRGCTKRRIETAFNKLENFSNHNLHFLCEAGLLAFFKL